MRSVVAAGLALASLLIAARVACAAPATDRGVVRLALSGGQLEVSQRNRATVLAYTTGGRRTATILPVDDTVPASSLVEAAVVAPLGRGVVALSTTYNSHPSMPVGACGAGSETVLRVIVLAPAPRQSFSQLIDSCWNTVEEGEVRADAAAHTLSIDRTVCVATGCTRTRTLYAVAADGRTTALRARRIQP